MSVSIMAWKRLANPLGFPMQSLKPIGLPSLSVRSLRMNSQSCLGVEKAEWYGGEAQSSVQGPGPRPRASDISAVILLAGKIPP